MSDMNPNPNNRESNGERDFNDLNKEEIIVLVKKVAAELGHRPNQFEFWQMAKAKKEHMRRLFGSYRELVQEAGFEALGPGFYITTDQLLGDWAAVVRKLGRIPSVMQYNKAGKYSHRAFRMRWKSWQDVPAAMMEWAAAKWPDRQWDDVVEIARRYTEQRRLAGPRKKKFNRLTSTEETGLTSTTKKAGAPVYGRPIMMQELATAPTNEAGVLFLFGALAKALGFMVLRVQSEFPDVEALRCGENGRWRRVRIELEFESKNFLLHGHDPRECDLIVCWSHNWPSSTVEVLELRSVVEKN
jgi:HNH endonuclease